MEIKYFTFNPFSENTYVLYDETGDCVVVDPGCAFPDEEEELSQFIAHKNLTVKNVLLTHAHVDHIMGCDYVCKKYNVGITMHKEDVFMLERGPQIGQMYGFPVKQAPEPTAFLEENDVFSFGSTKLHVIFTPGHSPGSISFIDTASKSVILGDIIIQNSIGRTDLPGGDLKILLQSIQQKIFTLPDDYKIFGGHGTPSTVGYEKQNNQLANEIFQ